MSSAGMKSVVVEAINFLLVGYVDDKVNDFEQLKDGLALGELLCWVKDPHSHISSTDEFKSNYVATLSRLYHCDVDSERVLADDRTFFNSVLLFLNVVLRSANAVDPREGKVIRDFCATGRHALILASVNRILFFSQNDGGHVLSSCREQQPAGTQSQAKQHHRSVAATSSAVAQATDQSAAAPTCSTPAYDANIVNDHESMIDFSELSKIFNAPDELLGGEPLKYSLKEPLKEKEISELFKQKEDYRLLSEAACSQFAVNEKKLEAAENKIAELITHIHQMENRSSSQAGQSRLRSRESGQSRERRPAPGQNTGISLGDLHHGPQNVDCSYSEALGDAEEEWRRRNNDNCSGRSPAFTETPRSRRNETTNVDMGALLKQVGIAGRDDTLNSVLSDQGTLAPNETSRFSAVANDRFQLIEIVELKELRQREQNFRESFEQFEKRSQTLAAEGESLKSQLETKKKELEARKMELEARIESLKKELEKANSSAAWKERSQVLVKENNDLKNKLIKTQNELIQAQKVIAFLKDPDATSLSYAGSETGSKRLPIKSSAMVDKAQRSAGGDQVFTGKLPRVAHVSKDRKERRLSQVRSAEVRTNARRAGQGRGVSLSTGSLVEAAKRTVPAVVKRPANFSHPSSLTGRMVTSSNNRLLTKVGQNVAVPRKAATKENTPTLPTAQQRRSAVSGNVQSNVQQRPRSSSLTREGQCKWCRFQTNPNKPGDHFDHVTSKCPERRKYLTKGYWECATCQAGFIALEAYGKHCDRHATEDIRTPRHPGTEMLEAQNVQKQSRKRPAAPVSRGAKMAKRPRL